MALSVALAAPGLAASVPVQADAPKHTWFMLNYALGKCEFSAQSPEQFYNGFAVLGHLAGLAFDRITPEDVGRYADGNIHVHMTGTRDGAPVHMDFFTAIRQCEQFIVDFGIKPEQAPADDIN